MIETDQIIADLRARNRTLETDLSRTKGQLAKAYTDRARIHQRLISITRRLGKYEQVDPPEPIPEDPTRQSRPHA